MQNITQREAGGQGFLRAATAKRRTHQLPLSSSFAAMVSWTPIPGSSTTDSVGSRTLTRCRLQATAGAGAREQHLPTAERPHALRMHSARLATATGIAREQQRPAPGRGMEPAAGTQKKAA